MNSCILMARIVESPKVRYTQDNQTPIAEIRVEFDGLRSDDPPTMLKVVGWGDYMSSEMKEKYTQGDRIIVEGRLRMNTIERSEGFKEKRAELWASRIHKLDNTQPTVPVQPISPTAVPANDMTIDEDVYKPLVPEPTTPSPSPISTPSVPSPPTDKDLDDIPF